MKILASGDHHYDEHSRFDECKRVHAWIADEVERQRPDVFLSGGDVYERASTPLERAAVAEWLTTVAETCPIIIAKGNHDRPHDCELLGRLRTRHPVIVEERCGVHRVGDAAIAVLAWPNRANLLAALGKNGSTQHAELVAKDALQSVLRGIGSELAGHNGPRVLLTHAMINGAVTSVGQPLVGAEMNVGLEDLGLSNADIVVASHIHCPQEWSFGEMPIVYCGSPFRTAFGEVEEKSILMAEWNHVTHLGDRRVSALKWSRIATPATQMLLVEDEWGGGRWLVGMSPLGAGADADVLGAEVRLRYRVPADERQAAKLAAQAIRDRWLAAGAINVKLNEQVIPTVRARSPEIAQARTTGDKLATLWKARNDVPDAERQARLLSKLSELEVAV